MGKSWDDVMNGAKLTPDEIRELYNVAMGKINGARVTIGLTQKQIQILQTICTHPRKEEDRCSDCGENWSDD